MTFCLHVAGWNSRPITQCLVDSQHYLTHRMIAASYMDMNIIICLRIPSYFINVAKIKKWSETLAHGFYPKIHVSPYAAGGQLTPNP